VREAHAILAAQIAEGRRLLATEGVEVETVRLDTLLTAHGSPRVTFLKVDTEGFDLPVLRTFPWQANRPMVVVCEFEDHKTVPLGYTYRDMADFLVNKRA